MGRKKVITDINEARVEIRIELYQEELTLGEVISFCPGQIIEIKEPIKICMGKKVIALGELIRLDEAHWGVRITRVFDNIIKTKNRDSYLA